jgi:pimeloyl-ACP methyl ester carboxylesterase
MRIVVALIATLLSAGAARAELAVSVVPGRGGVPLTVVQTGNASGPAILFIHGYSQSYLSWEKQLGDAELQKRFHLIALDLRGHGASGKPWEPAAYASEAWADDIAAVIAATGNRRPVLVPWSMGGSVTGSYILHNGDGAIAGVDFVAAAVSFGKQTEMMDAKDPANAEKMKAIQDMMSNDLLKNLAGTRAFVGALTAKPLPAAETETILVYNMLTPAYVRNAMFGGPRPDYTQARGKIAVPTLFTQGDKDALVPVQMSRDNVAALPGAKLSLYEGVGHAPFLEDAARFNRELADFVVKANARSKTR